MPGWHERTTELRESGAVRMVGLIQEQHPDRARLFMQWKEMGWPVMADPLNLLGVKVVPITVLIDEAGIIRKLGARPGDLDAFIALPPATVSERAPAPEATPAADDLVMWGDPEALDEVIDAFYPARLAVDADDGPTHFRLGVAYRKRAESDRARPGDFAAAVTRWRRALEIDPNQYIWRRRIQQYGPRLDKPYPFYDWVHRARDEITARGETPVSITVEPGGAEIARPERTFSSAADEIDAPDPEARIERDRAAFVTVETVVVPDTGKGRAAARVHLVFRPNASSHAHWNNEAEDLGVWIDPPDGWSVDRRWHTVARPAAEVSDEPRTIEFEIAPADGAPAASVTVPAYALYYVCEGVDGVCLYRRQDLALEIDLSAQGR